MFTMKKKLNAAFFAGYTALSDRACVDIQMTCFVKVTVKTPQL